MAYNTLHRVQRPVICITTDAEELEGVLTQSAGEEQSSAQDGSSKCSDRKNIELTEGSISWRRGSENRVSGLKKRVQQTFQMEDVGIRPVHLDVGRLLTRFRRSRCARFCGGRGVSESGPQGPSRPYSGFQNGGHPSSICESTKQWQPIQIARLSCALRETNPQSAYG